MLVNEAKQMSGEKQGQGMLHRGQCLYGKTKSPRQTHMKVFLSFMLSNSDFVREAFSKWVDYNFNVM